MAVTTEAKPAEKKRFVVREGFVVEIETETKGTGGAVNKSVKTLGGGETLTLSYDEYLPHAHKLEFADKKDRDAALEDEEVRAKSKAAADPLAAFSHLLAALTAHAAATGVLPGLTPAQPPATE